VRIDVERKSSDHTRQLWSFFVVVNHGDQIILRLNTYRNEHRATPRHKWQPITRTQSCFDSGDNRTYGDGRGLPSWDVPLPEDVRAEAASKAAEKIIVLEVQPHHHDPKEKTKP
jgi:hypothetical protein